MGASPGGTAAPGLRHGRRGRHPSCGRGASSLRPGQSAAPPARLPTWDGLYCGCRQRTDWGSGQSTVSPVVGGQRPQPCCLAVPRYTAGGLWCGLPCALALALGCWSTALSWRRANCFSNTASLAASFAAAGTSCSRVAPGLVRCCRQITASGRSRPRSGRLPSSFSTAA